MTHNLPVKEGSASGTDAEEPTEAEPKTTGISGGGGESSPLKDALPFIIAGAGGIIVVAAIIIVEKVVMPKRRARKNGTDGKNE